PTPRLRLPLFPYTTLFRSFEIRLRQRHRIGDEKTAERPGVRGGGGAGGESREVTEMFPQPGPPDDEPPVLFRIEFEIHVRIYKYYFFPHIETVRHHAAEPHKLAGGARHLG